MGNDNGQQELPNSGAGLEAPGVDINLDGNFQGKIEFCGAEPADEAIKYFFALPLGGHLIISSFTQPIPIPHAPFSDPDFPSPERSTRTEIASRRELAAPQVDLRRWFDALEPPPQCVSPPAETSVNQSGIGEALSSDLSGEKSLENPPPGAPKKLKKPLFTEDLDPSFFSLPVYQPLRAGATEFAPKTLPEGPLLDLS